MNSILVINSSLSGAASVSQILVKDTVRCLLEVNPKARLTYCELNQTSSAIDAGGRTSLATQADSTRRALPDELVSELKTADVVVIGAPMQVCGDELAKAISAHLFAKPSGADRNPRGLAPWQLRRVIDYMEACLPQRIELACLAAMVGLSQAHFSRAFKASTGLAPYRWQLDSRIRVAQELLINTTASLDQVAEATGFADAVHFGRTFRKHIGVTPAVWRNDRKN